MPFSKSYPSCSDEVHIRKLACQICGCVLQSSKPLTVTVDTIKQRTRGAVLERALETEEETAKRKKLNKERAVRSRALDKAGERIESLAKIVL